MPMSNPEFRDACGQLGECVAARASDVAAGFRAAFSVTP